MIKTTIRVTFLVLAYLMTFAPTASGQIAAEKPEQRDARMQWWREARFGMFVHWGLYSGLAGSWKGEAVAERGGMEWLQFRVKAQSDEYAKEATPHFKPGKDFAVQWAKLAKQAGCKYVVFTTKHHDGFSLHDSSVTTFDAKDLVGRDLCKEIVDACKAEGLKVGFYHSLIDWHHPHYDYKNAEGLPHPLTGKESPNGPREQSIYVDYLHHQVEELMTSYGTVDIVWWDYSKPDAQGPFWGADDLMKMVRKHQPDIVSNNRLYKTGKLNESDKKLAFWKPEHGDFTTPEQHIPSTGLAGVDWEVCMTMNTTWGFSQHDNAWKSNTKLIHNMIDSVSKGGNFLLNIGPRGDGSVPVESINSLQAIGRWMDVNGESIHGSQASPFEKPEWGRFTIKARTLYAHVFEWPSDGKLTIASKDIEVSRAWLLAEKESRLSFNKTERGLVLDVPPEAPDAIASVIAIELTKAK